MMREAIKDAYIGVAHGQGPFGAVIAKDCKLIAKAHNTVIESRDPTKHAEINCISKAARKLKTPHFLGCVIYSTCEPCPMCFTAIHWARIKEIVYGAGIKDAVSIGFRELTITNSFMKKKGHAHMKITSDVLKNECVEMMKSWAKNSKHKLY